MNCCGNKRSEWLSKKESSQSHVTIEKTFEPKIADKNDRMFEYTGNYKLSIIGVNSGKTYHFKFKGDKIKIDHDDSFAMMAERELKALPQ